MKLAQNLVIWPIDRLKPYEKNARTHSDAQVDQLAASITEFGFTNPVLVDSQDGIIAGHGRLMAAKRLGLSEVPVIVLDHLSDEQRRAYIIADNKLALNAGWDAEVLQSELADLDNADFDLSSIGFTDDELEAILSADEPDSVISSDPTPTLKKQIIDLASEIEKQEEDKEARLIDEDRYTKKIAAPIYEPKGEKPEISDMLDNSKCEQLISEIESSEAPEEVKSFLRAAAYRHSVFNYANIAEYYAHASPEIQALMENSALVIIDFNKAIENGFVVLSEEIAGVLASET